jgi:hypothetical protein
MGTYGDFTGVVRWYDETNKVGRVLGLKDGEIQAEFNSDGELEWAAGTGKANADVFSLDDPESDYFFLWDRGGSIETSGDDILSWDGTDEILYAEALLTWKAANTELDSSGNLIATNATLSGTITASAGSIGGWTINSAYLAKDTGTDATSAGLAPLDYPFYAGATYANRASATFRVTPVGAMTSTSATITGTVNWGSGKGQLNSTGFEFEVDANNKIEIDTTSPDNVYLRSIRDDAGSAAKFKTSHDDSASQALLIDHAGEASGIYVITTPTGGNDDGVSVKISSALDNGKGVYAVADTAVQGHGGSTGGLFSSGSDGIPLHLLIEYNDESVFVHYQGDSASGEVDKTIVDVGDVTTATIAGYIKVYVTDDGNQITDQAYYQPIYTLA